jgi:hypothetical protein
MITTLAVITETVVGVTVGVEFAVAVFENPILSPEPRSPSPFTTSRRPWGEFGVGQFERRANEGHDK